MKKRNILKNIFFKTIYKDRHDGIRNVLIGCEIDYVNCLDD